MLWVRFGIRGIWLRLIIFALQPYQRPKKLKDAVGGTRNNPETDRVITEF